MPTDPAIVAGQVWAYTPNRRLTNLADARAALIDLITALRMAELDPVNMPADIESILGDLGTVAFYRHSRWRVYPQDVTTASTITAGTPANTFGSWVEVIPLNTVTFPFHIVGFCVCNVNAVTNYHIQIGYNTINADPGTNMEMGERRIRIATTPIAKQSELMAIAGQGVPANSRVMARLKTASGNPDTATLSVVLSRHVEVTDPVPLWPAFPW